MHLLRLLQEPLLRRLHARLSAPAKLDPVRPEYHRASLQWAPPSPQWPPRAAQGAEHAAQPGGKNAAGYAPPLGTPASSGRPAPGAADET